MVYVLDTHTLVWFFEGNKLLGLQSRNIIRNKLSRLILPTIVLAEIKHLATRKKVPVVFSHVLEILEKEERFLIYPFDLSVLEAMPVNLEIHDAIICGTALVYQTILQEKVTVLTKDEAIRKSGLVTTVW